MKKQSIGLLLIITALVSVGNPVNAVSSEGALGWLKMGVKALPLAQLSIGVKALYDNRHTAFAFSMYKGQFIGIDDYFLKKIINTTVQNSLTVGFMQVGAKAGRWVNKKINPESTGEWGAALGAGLMGGVSFGYLGSLELPIPIFKSIELIKMASAGYAVAKTASWGYEQVGNMLSEKKEALVSTTSQKEDVNAELTSIKARKPLID